MCVQTQVLGLTRWMDEMELFLKAEVPALGDVETLEAQLQESQVGQSSTGWESQVGQSSLSTGWESQVGQSSLQGGRVR